MTSRFDLHASEFERHRALPAGVPEAIRAAIREVTDAQPSARVLDLGAGSGRFGRAFVEAGDSYVGVDLSLPMLREFRLRSSAASLLQADGEQLPFRNSHFQLVLLMQVLAGSNNWRGLLCEIVRVTAPGGFVVVGHSAAPANGVDVQMKKQLALILEEMGIAAHEPKKSRDQALAWLQALSSQSTQLTAASWTVQRTPQEFLDRHRSGARFSALPAALQAEALQKVSEWAAKTFGALDNEFPEVHNFELHVFRIANHLSS